MSIGVVTVAYGSAYQRFLPEWAQAVAKLNTPPEQVTIICDTISAEHLDMLESTIRTCNVRVMLSLTVPEHHPQILVNEAIAATSTEWICKMDVDDIILPYALDKVANCQADVLMFGIVMSVWNADGTPKIPHSHVPMLAQKVTAQQIAQSPHNLVFSGSPFRKTVWEKAPFRDMIYEDWAFWIEAAKNGAQFAQTDSLDYEYRIHDKNISMWCDDAAAKQKIEAIRCL